MSKTTLTPSEHAEKLLSVIDALAVKVLAQQETIATAVVASFVCDRKYTLDEFLIGCAVCGTSASTIATVKKNGASVVTTPPEVDNADADGTTAKTRVFTAAEVECDVGDLLEIEITTAPGSGTGFFAQLKLLPDFA